MHDWRNFIQLTEGRPAWPRLVRAAELATPGGDALDLGSGGGRDTRHLLRGGFHVTAVDASPWAAPAHHRLPHQRRLRFVQSSIEDFIPDDYDLVNAQFSLPFIPPERFSACVARLVESVRPRGILAATFFGPNDEWNVPGSPLSFLRREDVEALIGRLDVVELSEEDHDGHTADGTPKHWHVYHVIAARHPEPPAPA